MKKVITRPMPPRRHVRECGSALLIVFVFAAVIAIMLYRELPSVLFEARRQKEQLLVDRGHEYVRAVQLYYRRNQGQYPASIDQLVKGTNNVRYLRREYKDPFTGKNDWRLLHAGPGGTLIDSQVNRGFPGLPGATGVPGANGATAAAGTGNSSSFGSSQSGFSNSGFSNSGFSNSGSSNSGFNANSSSGGFGSSPASAPEVVVPDVPRRAPAVLAAGGGAGAGSAANTPSSEDLAENPDIPLLPEEPVSNPTGPSVTSSGKTEANANPQETNPMPLMQPLLNSPTNTGTPVQPGGFGQTGQQSNFGQSSSSTQSSFGQSTMGHLSSGGIAGVASKAWGHSIKLIEDQKDYSKWEFYYDPSKDRLLRAGSQIGTGSPANAPSGSLPGQQTGFGQQQSSFTQSSFGQNNTSGSTTGSAFSSSFNNPGAQAQQQQNPNSASGQPGNPEAGTQPDANAQQPQQ